MNGGPLAASVFVWWWLWCGEATAFALARTKEAATGKNAAGNEPTCEELKAMWRFSKRQSRAAEITNEIPMYRDPFSDNVWEPYYATSRSIGGMRMGHFRNRPVYGRVVHKPPSTLRIHDPVERNRAFQEMARTFGKMQPSEPRRRVTAFRLSGGAHLPSLGLPPQSGSFQHLKELIRTERARELQEQRMAEEVAARTAALKELTGAGNHWSQANYRDINYNYDIDGREDEHENYMVGGGSSGGGGGGVPAVGGGGIIFPDLLAPPASRHDVDIPDYGYGKERPRAQTSSLYHGSSFNDDFDGLML